MEMIAPSTICRLALILAASVLILCVDRSCCWGYEINLTGKSAPALKEAVLFPFDRVCLPFRHGLQMELLTSRWDDRGPVIEPGPPGSPDSTGISYYGTVLQVGGKIRLWYLANGDAPGEPDTLRICYAESEDGFHFVKPKLGLVRYGGNTENNIVDTGIEGRPMACVVLHEPDDPDPKRAYKLFVEGVECRGSVAFSEDGLRWRPSPRNPVTVPFEPTGLLKRDGCYYVYGQTAGDRSGFRKRVLCVLASYDFENWTVATAMGFRRDTIPPHPVHKGYNTGKQVHIGAGMWDRGNVAIGLYGQWDGDPLDDDRRFMKMNLGLVVTHDGLCFEEPIPDFPMIRNIEEGWTSERPMGYPPRLAQGQGMAEVGGKTLAYYSHWGKGASGKIWAANWERDRFGFFAPTSDPEEGQWMNDRAAPHCISCPIRIGGRSARVFINASNLSEHGYLTVEVLDVRFQPLPGYAADHSTPLKNGGFRVPVKWGERESIEAAEGAVRLRINWHGIRPEDPKLYAVYVEAGG